MFGQAQLQCVPGSRVYTNLWKVLSHSAQRCRPAHCHAGTWVRGAQNTPHPPSTPAFPRGPWETLSHTRGYQNSSLVFNYGPFEAMPRKIPCRRTVLRTWSSQVRSLFETRTAGNISGVVYSIYLTSLLIGMCLLRELGDSRVGPGARKPRGLPCLHTRPADGLCRQRICPQNASEMGGRLCCGFNKQHYLLSAPSPGTVQHRCQEDPGAFIPYWLSNL